MSPSKKVFGHPINITRAYVAELFAPDHHPLVLVPHRTRIYGSRDGQVKTAQDIETPRQFYEGTYYSTLFIRRCGPSILITSTWEGGPPRACTQRTGRSWRPTATPSGSISTRPLFSTRGAGAHSKHEEAGAGGRVLLPLRLRRHARLRRGRLSRRNHAYRFAVRQPVCAMAAGCVRQSLRGGSRMVRIHGRAGYRARQQRWRVEHRTQPGARRECRVRNGGRRRPPEVRPGEQDAGHKHRGAAIAGITDRKSVV